MAPNYSSQEGEPYEGDSRGVPKPPTPGAPEPTGDPTQPKPAEGPAEPGGTFSFGEPPPAPQGQEWDPLALKDYDVAVQDLGATPEVAREFLELYRDHKPPADEAAYEAQKHSAVAELRKAWGADFDSKLEAAIEAAKRLPPTILAELDMSGLGNNVRIIQFFADLGMNARGAQDALNKILGDKSSPYWHQSDPRHEAMMREVQRLYGQIYSTRGGFEPVR